MNQEDKKDRLPLYTAFTNFSVENLLWKLIYLNNIAFNTPLRLEARAKLMGMSRSYETLICNIYTLGVGRQLVSAMAESNRLFVEYVDAVMQGGSQANSIKRQWKESGTAMAKLLCSMNPYWQAAEWDAMIGHETDLLDTIACGLKSRNYNAFFNTAPICGRLAIDMSNYMCTGLSKQFDCPDQQ